MQYWCKQRERRQAVADATKVNGIDYLEVSASQLALEVHFIHNLPGGGGAAPIPPNPPLTKENFAVEGGVRILDVKVVKVDVTAKKVLRVTVDRAGDFSPYRLKLVKAAGESAPPDGFDPRLAEVEFSFKVDCPSEFDCLPERACPPPQEERPRIDYLAKDYASFRRLMLDRLSLIAPQWRSRHAADLPMMLVEWLAYVGDHLSYYQDAVATEAYLGTARRRTSVRRHARALDYFMHEGANARCFVVFDVGDFGTTSVTLSKGTRLLTKTAHADVMMKPDKFDALADAEAGLAFETLHDKMLYYGHNRIRFYTWSDDDCCLPRGATRATLWNQPTLLLIPGDVLIFEEERSPETGAEADADRSRRHAVRLKRVTKGIDPLTDIAVLEIEWHEEDALPFALRVSAMVREDGGTTPTPREISVARGNVVLADHGLRKTQPPGLAPAEVAESENSRVRYRPRLEFQPLTFQAPLVLDGSAHAALHSNPRRALPVIELIGTNNSRWSPRHDLLESGAFSQEFVVETEDDGSAWVRFGDDRHGRRPNAGERFRAEYRVGNGRAGNVGAEAIAHVAGTGLNIVRVRNPLPATGGEDPETLEHVRLFAPQAFRAQERAVTERDYAQFAERAAGVQRAQASFRWTGSWHTAFVTVDRTDGRSIDAQFEESMRAHLEPYRMAGYDVEINGPRFVPLEILLRVCVAPQYLRADVKQSLLRRLGAADLPDGSRGFFHPDNFSLGQPLYLSRLYDAAMAVQGVASLEVVKFQRWGKPAGQETAQGALRVARLEILRLDNDPNFPENGRLELDMRGGL